MSIGRKRAWSVYDGLDDGMDSFGVRENVFGELHVRGSGERKDVDDEDDVHQEEQRGSELGGLDALAFAAFPEATEEGSASFGRASGNEQEEDWIATDEEDDNGDWYTADEGDEGDEVASSSSPYVPAIVVESFDRQSPTPLETGVESNVESIISAENGDIENRAGSDDGEHNLRDADKDASPRSTWLPLTQPINYDNLMLFKTVGEPKMVDRSKESGQHWGRDHGEDITCKNSFLPLTQAINPTYVDRHGHTTTEMDDDEEEVRQPATKVDESRLSDDHEVKHSLEVQQPAETIEKPKSSISSSVESDVKVSERVHKSSPLFSSTTQRGGISCVFGGNPKIVSATNEDIGHIQLDDGMRMPKPSHTLPTTSDSISLVDSASALPNNMKESTNDEQNTMFQDQSKVLTHHQDDLDHQAMSDHIVSEPNNPSLSRGTILEPIPVKRTMLGESQISTQDKQSPQEPSDTRSTRYDGDSVLHWIRTDFIRPSFTDDTAPSVLFARRPVDLKIVETSTLLKRSSDHRSSSETASTSPPQPHIFTPPESISATSSDKALDPSRGPQLEASHNLNPIKASEPLTTSDISLNCVPRRFAPTTPSDVEGYESTSLLSPSIPSFHLQVPRRTDSGYASGSDVSRGFSDGSQFPWQMPMPTPSDDSSDSPGPLTPSDNDTSLVQSPWIKMSTGEKSLGNTALKLQFTGKRIVSAPEKPSNRWVDKDILLQDGSRLASLCPTANAILDTIVSPFWDKKPNNLFATGPQGIDGEKGATDLASAKAYIITALHASFSTITVIPKVGDLPIQMSFELPSPFNEDMQRRKLRWRRMWLFEREPISLLEPNLVTIEKTLYNVLHTFGYKIEGDITFLGEGSFNRAYTIPTTTKHGNKKDFVFRLAFATNPYYKVANEVATMEYVTRFTKVQVPRVYAFDPSSANDIGGEWILMEKASGVRLAEAWRTLSMIARERLTRQVAQWQHDLTRLVFNKIGSIFMSNVENRLHFYVGQAQCSVLIDDRSLAYNTYRGPFQTLREYYHTMLEFSNNMVDDCERMRANPPKTSTYDVEDPLRDLLIQADAEDQEAEEDQGPSPATISDAKEDLTLLRLMIPYLCHEDDREPFRTFLQHWDLSDANIFVDEAGNLTAFIDWERIVLEPFGHMSFFPRYLESQEMYMAPPGTRGLRLMEDDPVTEDHLAALRGNDPDNRDYWRVRDNVDKTTLRAIYEEELERLQSPLLKIKDLENGMHMQLFSKLVEPTDWNMSVKRWAAQFLSPTCIEEVMKKTAQ